MKRLLLAAALAVTAISTTACVYGPGPRWCYWHPHRC